VELAGHWRSHFPADRRRALSCLPPRQFFILTEPSRAPRALSLGRDIEDCNRSLLRGGVISDDEGRTRRSESIVNAEGGGYRRLPSVLTHDDGHGNNEWGGGTSPQWQ